MTITLEDDHTFHLLCGEMAITLKDVAYQLGFATEGEPVSGCMTGWETFYEGQTMEDLCQQLLGAVPGENGRQAAGKWVVNMTWFRDTVCQGVSDNATEERLM
ncbi:hypothetical protein PIB30_051836 [Stylosanthes scabra]|uniref:Aminotransferase-like plant mobile domain-containing protein n=1 Tax=Stylosanthes scabra TaxID=79078 RepID=A0ABU6XFR2_9FABA|nr:hypothetical protein [Stylosanthes scabra]